MILRKTFLALLAQFALLAGAASAATDADLDVDADLMRSVEDTTKGLDSDVALKDAKDAASLARELVQTFARIEAHYARTPDTADAVGFARRTRELAAQSLKAIESQDFDAAANLVNDLTHSCKTCHNVYKKD